MAGTEREQQLDLIEEGKFCPKLSSENTVMSFKKDLSCIFATFKKKKIFITQKCSSLVP